MTQTILDYIDILLGDLPADYQVFKYILAILLILVLTDIFISFIVGSFTALFRR